MSLTQVWSWLIQHPAGPYLAAVTALTFIALYAAARSSAWRTEQARLERIRLSLELYGAAAGPLQRAAEQRGACADADALLMDRLQACKAAPYLTADLQGQIGAYLADGDEARLPLLHRALDREAVRLMEERAKLLARSEQPGWGLSLWQQLQAMLPFAFAAAAVLLTAWLLQALGDAAAAGGSEAAWTRAAIWARFASILLSLLLLYPALLANRRPGGSTSLLRLLSLFTALLALVHLAGLETSLYVLAVQLLLFLLGFSLTGAKPRKARPFAGHYDDTALQTLLLDAPAGTPDNEERPLNADTDGEGAASPADTDNANKH
ncbi:hypothetical protein [Paenibacillus sp. YPG26]|uniref:hypothetical protein n=1 Tax=Paenibacillus sp. YPG26 TaxID=2878915 RepID=UPI0020413A0D|nr:hypothetical protein [Paenibacillus sp. YPG26]USB33720.1 hypothetical protein LDO05_02525 [Paenibacillus sp. YPG26]